MEVSVDIDAEGMVNIHAYFLEGERQQDFTWNTQFWVFTKGDHGVQWGIKSYDRIVWYVGAEKAITIVEALLAQGKYRCHTHIPTIAMDAGYAKIHPLAEITEILPPDDQVLRTQLAALKGELNDSLPQLPHFDEIRGAII